MIAAIDPTREQAMNASKRYLDLKGYEVKGTWENDGLSGLVAADEDGLAFVQVRCQNAESTEQETPEAMRHKFERAAIDWLANREEDYDADFPVRFDVISLFLVNRERALLRHHMNALCVC